MICRRNVICNNVLRLADALLIVQVLNDCQSQRIVLR
ncbi:capsid protein [Escherichia coli]|nr:capsid protein [Escherichia coli]EFJ4024806.1 capsid protein [Escherichia coli]